MTALRQSLLAYSKRLGLEKHGLEVVNDVNLLPDKDDSILDLAPGRRPGVEWGRETEIAGQLSMQAVEKAVELCMSGQIDAMVTEVEVAFAISPGRTRKLRRATNHIEDLDVHRQIRRETPTLHPIIQKFTKSEKGM